MRDGEIVAAAQEERFTRKKHDADFPANALRYCVKEAGIAWRDIDFVTFYEKPFLKFERLLETYLAFAPKGFGSFRMAMPLWLKEKLFQKSLLIDLLRAEAPDIDWDKKLRFTEHHESHAASAFYPSPFSDAAILTMDGVGEWATTSMGVGSGNQLSLNEEIHFPHSLGLLYSAFTYYTGFKVNSGEYKVMGLAPYGEPKYAQAILDNLIDVQADGSFRMNMDYFDYCTGLRMTNGKFDALFGGPPRKRGGIADAARDGSRRVDPGGDRGDRAAADARARGEDRAEESLPRRRRRAQLRGQRQGAARRQVRSDLDPAGGGRCGRGGRRGARDLLPRDRRGAPERRQPTPCAASYLGPAYSRRGHRGSAQINRRSVRCSDRGSADTGDLARLGGGRGGRLVPGADGIRPARARRPLDPRRSSLADDAEDAEPQGEVSRVVPPLRAGGAARARRRLVRARLRQPVHAARRRRSARAAPRNDRG